jgi:C4-dicarboxylate transporter, DctM subunit
LPIFLPIARELGWDLVWFGVTIMIGLAIGLITPPVGINLFVAANITRLSLQKVAVAVVPFLVTSLIGLALVAAMPGLASVMVRALE